jgi:hypothetical protein
MFQIFDSLGFETQTSNFEYLKGPKDVSISMVFAQDLGHTDMFTSNAEIWTDDQARQAKAAVVCSGDFPSVWLRDLMGHGSIWTADSNLLPRNPVVAQFPHAIDRFKFSNRRSIFVRPVPD